MRRQSKLGMLGVFGTVVALCCATTAVESPPNERDWCERLAPKYGAEVEVVLWDGSRCDLVTATEAIEVDWAAKWPEAIGQSQYYGLLLRKQPAVLLLVKNGEERFAYRCQAVCAKLEMPLHVEVVP